MHVHTKKNKLLLLLLFLLMKHSFILHYCLFFTQAEYSIPKGTQVWPNLHELLHDERHWKDPHKFDPLQFLDAEGKFTGIPPSFKPFGTGRRVCIGESLAKSELLVRLHCAARLTCK